MKVEARNINIDNILKKGKYTIPEYQRDYDWSVDNVEELVEDILKWKKGYFIGHMVFDGKFSENDFYVIDGQQRITTIVILLCVIRDSFFSKGESELANGVNDNYIFSKDRNNKLFTIFNSESPYPFFQKQIQSIGEEKESVDPHTESEKSFKKIYDYFNKKINSFTTEELKDFRDKILELEVIFVAVEEGDPFIIFSTLNATGKDLTTLDMIKNHVFRKWPNKQPHINEPNDTWKAFMDNLKGNTKFLNYFWSSRFKKVSDIKIYKEFKNEIVGKDINVKDFLNTLYSDSIIFSTLNSSNDSNWQKDEKQIQISIDAILNIFNIKVANSFLISLVRVYRDKLIDKKGVIKILSSIERYHFINNAISSLRSSGLDTMYAKYAKSLFESKNKQNANKVLSELKKKLEDKIPKIEEYYNTAFEQKTFFIDKDTKNKKIVNYILKKIEYKKQGYNIFINNISLEHLISQSIKDDNVVGKIGNLVLLDSDLNSKIGNKEYGLKRKSILKKSNILTTNEVLEKYENFTELNINERVEKIKRYMFSEVWS